jgi:uncharacterized protein YndB with AHSA1/START domain
MNTVNETGQRSQTHATFVIERTFPVALQRVWYALSDNDARDQWFGGGAEFAVDGLDTVEGREAGTRGLLDNLGALLARVN